MLSFYLRIKNLFREEEGQDLIEYALIVALLVILGAATIITGGLGGGIDSVWAAIEGWLGGLALPGGTP